MQLKQYMKEILFLIDTDRKKIPFLIFLFFMLSMLDVVGLGLIGPYIALLIEPSSMQSGALGQLIIDMGLPKNQKELLVILGVALLGIFFIKAIFSVVVNYLILKFSQEQQVKIRSNLMESYQHMTYAEFLQRNSSEYIYSIQNLATNFSNNIVMVGLRTIGDIIIALAVFIMLAWTNAAALLLLVCLLGLMIFSYDQIFHRKIYEYGEKINKALVLMTRGISESVNGFKEIQVLGKRDFFYRKVRKSALDYSKNNLDYQVISIIPRYLLEFLLITFVVLLVMGSILLQHSTSSLISLIGVFGMAAMRLMPIANGLSNSISQLRFGRDTVSRLYNDLSNNQEYDREKLDLKKTSGQKFKNIELDEVSFNYSQTGRAVLDNVSLKISNGESIGLIGPSGSGKTTLIDMLLGLHKPTSGKIKYNNKGFHKALGEWRSQVAYLPQNVFLIDDTLKSNVALGVDKDKVNNERVFTALKQARLQEFSDRQPNGLDTILGEGGIRLSGGQRQRIALARAFYHGRSILIMDESTSSLDEDVENEIVEEIRILKGKKTMIIISHRPSILKYCDKIYKIENGKLLEEKM